MSKRLGGNEEWEALAVHADFQPAKMADLCLVSLRHLQRLCAEHFQKTPGEWARELQCRLARKLIAKGYSTKAVAAELKFANECHFCREFKKVYGVSPQTFSPGFRPALPENVPAPMQNVAFRQ